jgi:hypothetical protein
MFIWRKGAFMILQWKEKPSVITVGTPWSNDVLLNQIISMMVCRTWLMEWVQ